MRLADRRVSLSKAARDIRNTIYPSQNNDTGGRLAAQLAVEGLLAAIVLNLATVYTSMFANRMGATATQIALAISLPQFFAMVILIPATLFNNRLHDKRRPVEIAVILTGLFYGLAGFAPFTGGLKIWFLIGMVALANVPLSLYNSSWQNYFSDIVQPSDRNAFYTVRTSMTFFAGIVVVQLTGIILGSAQTDQMRIWLYQGCYWLAFLVTWLQLRVLRSSPPDLGVSSTSGWRDLKAAIIELLHCRRFTVFFGISIFFHFGWYMAWPLFFLAQVKYIGANESWLSYIAVSGSLLQWLTVKPWGRFIGKYGIRMTLGIGALGLAANPLFAVLATYLPAGYQLPGMLVFNLVNSCTFSAFQLSILQCLLEAVPVRFKALNLSIYTSFLLLANSIAPLLGTQIYVLLGTSKSSLALTMFISSLIRFIGAGLFFLRWRSLRSEPDCGMRQ